MGGGPSPTATVNPMDWNAFPHFIQEHTALAGVITFAIAFLESLAFIGIIMPGAAALIVIGTLIGTGHLGFWETSFAAFLGGLLGDGVSYALGRRYHQHVRDFSLVRRYEQILNLGEAYFRQKGATSIVVGRFIGPTRPVIPLVAGMCDMPVRRFIAADWLACLAWAPVYLAPGILVGAAVGLQSEQLNLFYWQLAGFIAAAWAAWWALRAALRLKRGLPGAVPRWLAGRPFTLLLPGSVAATGGLVVALASNPTTPELIRVIAQVLSR